jgi:hypothetical protein
LCNQGTWETNKPKKKTLRNSCMDTKQTLGFHCCCFWHVEHSSRSEMTSSSCTWEGFQINIFQCNQLTSAVSKKLMPPCTNTSKAVASSVSPNVSPNPLPGSPHCRVPIPSRETSNSVLPNLITSAASTATTKTGDLNKILNLQRGKILLSDNRALGCKPVKLGFTVLSVA